MHTINIFFHLHFRYYCRFSTELFHGIKVDKESDKEFFKKLRHEHMACFYNYIYMKNDSPIERCVDQSNN